MVKATKRRPRSEEAQPARPADSEWYASVFTAEERELIERQLALTPANLDAEVALMRMLIRRVMKQTGADDPAKTLPLVRQATDALCRALRAQRILTPEASDSIAEAIAVAVREIGEELGLGQQ